MRIIMVPEKVKNCLKIVQGDITKIGVDAIVNAANTSLLGGGGVDGAIHSAAGSDLYKACVELGGCDPGEARITKAFKLPAKFVIHTPGPVYRGGNANEKEILQNSYKNALQLAMENNCESIAFPAISTGVYNYPKDEAAKIAISTVSTFMIENNFFPEVTFVLFDDENYSEYLKAMK